MKYVLSFLCFVFLLSCTSEEEVNESNTFETKEVEDQTTTFDDQAFKGNLEMEVLEELSICEMKDSLPYIVDCSPENFKIIPFKNGVSIKDACIVEIKAGVMLKGDQAPLPPVRHIIAYERVDGILARINGFRGDLIETRSAPGKSTKDLLLALYLKSDDVLFQTRFTYEDGQYVFDEVERMDLGMGKLRTIKEEDKEEVNNQIYRDLVENDILFK